MIIEKGQVTIVASGSMASFATIENPVRGYECLPRASWLVCTCLMMTWSIALQDETSLREKQATP